MGELHDVWRFTRARLAGAWEDLSDAQLAWRPHPGAHCIAEILLHIAGAEHYWASRLTGRDPAATDFEAKLDRAVKDGFLFDRPFPFGPERFTAPFCEQALDFSMHEIEPIFASPSAAQLSMPMTSPIGDPVEGREGLIRLAQHAAYHCGQIWMLRMRPDFPTV